MRTPWWVWTTLFGALFGAALFYSAPDADASTTTRPSICATFDANPNFETVNVVMSNLVANGFTIDLAATAVVDAVETFCPQHVSLLQRYVDAGERQTR